MANIPLSSIKFPGLTDKYTMPEVDANLATPGAAADAKKTGDELTALKADSILQMDEIPDTVQSYAFVDGTVSQITHNRSGVAIRTDVFTYENNTITEARTLNTGESLTIVTNLTTLETTVTYAAD